MKVTLHLRIFLLLLCCTAFRLSAENSPVPLAFLENHGQITDQYGNPRTDILYYLRGNGLQVFLTANALHYQFSETDAQDDSRVNVSRLELLLKDANPSPRVRAEGPQAYREHFYTQPAHPEGITARSWQRITVADVWPGIDWVLYVQEGGLKYDFVVHPGADPRQILYRYAGATEADWVYEGAMQHHTPLGTIRDEAPVAWYARDPQALLPCRFAGVGDFLTLELPGLNGPVTQTLIIDPAVSWATYYGGTGTDNSQAVTTDVLNNVYMCGQTSSAANIATVGAHQTTLSTSPDAYVVKFNASGIRLWGTYYGGTGTTEAGYAVAAQGDSLLYLGGETNSGASIATAGAYQTGLGGGTDGFLVKISAADGTRRWATYYGGANNDNVRALTLNPATGDVYIAGSTNSSGGISSGTGHQTAFGGGTDAFLAKFNSSGVRQWATYAGGTSSDGGGALTLTPAGLVVLGGNTASTTPFFTPLAIQPTYGGGTFDGFLTAYNAVTGLHAGGSYLGGPTLDYITGLAPSGSTSIAVCGYTNSTSGIVRGTPHQGSLGGNIDGFIGRVNPISGSAWVSYYGGTGNDYCSSLFTDMNGSLIAAGNTNSSTGIHFQGTQTGLAGGIDLYWVMFDTTGKRVLGNYYGSTANDNGSFTAGDALGAVYLAGFSTGTTLATAGAHQTTGGGAAADGVLAKFAPTLRTDSLNDLVYCAGDSIFIPWKALGTFLPANDFIFELSDPGGTFVSPTVLATRHSVYGGTLRITLPQSLSTATTYRIRVRSTANPMTANDNGQDITIYALPVVSFGSPGTFCSNSTSVSLSTGAPAGGTYAGTGVVSGGFFPTVAGAGTFTLVYTYTDANTCTDTAQTHVVVHAAPVVDLDTLQAICENAPLLSLTAGTPAGGTYFGPGVSGTDFSPAVAGVGMHMLYYTFTDSNSCTSEDSAWIRVKAVPAVDFGALTPLCADAPAFTLSAGTPAGGVYTGAGVSGGSFDPAVSGTGTFTLYYSFTDTNGCADTDSAVQVVHALPAVTVAALPDLCLNSGLYTLTQGQPAGGTWSGTGITGGDFDPAAAGAGSHSLVYTYTDSNGCVNADTGAVQVHALPVVFAGIDLTVCENQAGPVQLGGSPAGGIWSGPGMTGVFFDPSIGAGVYDLVYTYADSNSCTVSDTMVMTVAAAPVVTYAQAGGPFCIEQMPYLLSGGLPAGGTYSGPGVTGSTFSITTAGSYTLTYTYTNAAGCVESATDTIQVSVCVNRPDAGLADVQLWPNPAQEMTQLRGTLPAGTDLRMRLVNPLGQVVWEQARQAVQAVDESIPLNGLSRGVYLLRLDAGASSRTFRLVVE